MLLNDVAAIANAVFRRLGTYNRTSLLEDHLTHTAGSSAFISEDARRRRLETIRSLLKESGAEDPYDGVTDEQKRLLRNARMAVERGDAPGAVFNLEELRTALMVTNRDYAKVARANKLAVPLAVVGLALTLLFGVAGSWSTVARLLTHRGHGPTQTTPSASRSPGDSTQRVKTR
jgi:hypothetical protein